MGRTGWRERAKYRFDNFMARGGRSIFVSLTAVFLMVLVIVMVTRAVVLTVSPSEASEQGTGFLRNLFVAFLEMTDPGSMALELGSSVWFKVAAVFAGLAGVVLLSALIAFITTALDQKLSSLKRGHSRVVESGHTLILGWNDQDVLEILRELVIANESERRAVVAVLADRDKEMMDDFLAVHLPERGTTQVVTRSGNPASTSNLELMSIDEAESIIILSGAFDTDSDDEKAASDSRVIKGLLAVVASRPAGKRLNIVTELMNPQFHEMARAISPKEISVLDGSRILARILVQTSRSVGLSVVYNEILSFEGAEMYFHSADWRGQTFGSLAPFFADGVPMGYRSRTGIKLNPPPDRTMEPGEAVLILANDDSTIDFLGEPVAVSRAVEPPARRLSKGVEHELIVGWTPKGPAILAEYAQYVVAGSRIDVMLRAPAPDLAAQLQALADDLNGLDVTVIDCDPMVPSTWETIDPGEYDNVLILGQGDPDHDTDRIDAETIMILILLRRTIEARTALNGGRVTKLITELVESDNRALATHAGVHDFVVSSKFISMLLAQISEERDMSLVYEDLFSEEGSEIYLKPITLYIDAFPARLRFIDLIALAQSRGEICLGIKTKAEEADAERNFGVQLVPPKGADFTLEADDCLVVLAEDET